MQTKIIYEDAQILVAHKPAGLATQSAKVGQPDMVSELKNYLAGQQSASENRKNNKEKSGAPYLGIIHRLDQPVEGLLVFAKTKEAAGKLTTQLAGGTLNKQYYAIVCGKPAKESGELVDYLRKEGNLAKVSNPQDKEAKKAVLQYQVLSYKSLENQGTCSLLDIHIDTGRFHQIRAQLSNSGLPILGDGKYGNALSLELSKCLKTRNVELYAYRLELKHPITGKMLEFTIEPEMVLQFPICDKSEIS